MGAAAQESSSSPGAEELGRLCSLVPYLARSDSAQEPRGNIFSPRRLGSGQSRWSWGERVGSQGGPGTCRRVSGRSPAGRPSPLPALLGCGPPWLCRLSDLHGNWPMRGLRRPLTPKRCPRSCCPSLDTAGAARALPAPAQRVTVCVRSPLHSRPRRRSCGPHIPGDNGPGERQRCRRRRASAHPSLPLGPGPPARSAAPTRRGSPASRGRRAERHAGRGQARPPPRRLGPACSPRHRRCLRCAPAEPGELGPGYCPRSAPAGRPGASGAVRTGGPLARAAGPQCAAAVATPVLARCLAAWSGAQLDVF